MIFVKQKQYKIIVSEWQMVYILPNYKALHSFFSIIGRELNIDFKSILKRK